MRAVVAVVVAVIAALMADVARRLRRCRALGQVPTFPGWVKRFKRSSGGESSLACARQTCTKTFSSDDAYVRERDVYLRRLPYVPRLLSYDDASRTLVVARTGRALGTVSDSGIPLVGSMLKRHRFHMYADRVRALAARFHADTGLHHNDVNFKNVLRDRHDRLYLIDFEMASEQHDDYDLDGILHADGGAVAVEEGNVPLAAVELVEQTDERAEEPSRRARVAVEDDGGGDVGVVRGRE